MLMNFTVAWSVCAVVSVYVTGVYIHCVTQYGLGMQCVCIVTWGVHNSYVYGPGNAGCVYCDMWGVYRLCVCVCVCVHAL